MIIYRRDKLGSTGTYTLFYNGEPLEMEKTYYTEFYQSYVKPDGVDAKIWHSATIDLNQTEEEIFQNFDKNCRYDVKRAERDGIITVHKEDDEITNNDLKTFYRFYNTFAKQKHLKKVNKVMIEECRKNGNLVMSFAYDSRDTSKSPIVYHIYLKDNIQCRLQYSCSLYRNKKINGQTVGRSNRLLQFKDIGYLKSLGLSILDLGGLGQREEVKNITSLKSEFGGIPKDYYVYAIIDPTQATFITKLKKFIKKILHKG